MEAPRQKPYAEPEDRATRASDLVLRYGVILGKRLRRAQKRRFLMAAARQFELCGFVSSLEEDRHVVRMAGSKRFHNLYAGDLAKAKVLFVTYYDTPTKSFSAEAPKAFQTNYRPRDAWASALVMLALALGALALAWVLAWPGIEASGMLSPWGLLLVALCVVVLALVTTCREGLAERDNVVRNSSSLAVLFDLAHRASEAGLSDGVAFALVDEGCRSERGLEMLRARLGRRGSKGSAKRVYVDSLGSDGRLVCLTNLRVPASWEKEADVRRLPSALRQKLGDYLVCAGEPSGEDVIVNRASEVSAERVMERSDALLDLVRFI